jgi:hypothetical protein
MKLIANIAITASLCATTLIPQAAAAERHLMAGQLLADCTAKPGAPEFSIKRAQCDSYLAGIFDLLFAHKTVAQEQCVPVAVNSDRLRKIVVTYLKEHPAEVSFAAANAVQSATAQAWPRCSLG